MDLVPTLLEIIGGLLVIVGLTREGLSRIAEAKSDD